MRPLIVANWKMNPLTLKGAKLLFNSVKKDSRNIKNVEVVICPPFVYLSHIGAFASAKGFGGLHLGSQDCFWEQSGAFTGEVSPVMLKDLGVEYVIIGHSERRRYFQETNRMINKKLKAVLSAKLKPILCIGETEKERRTGKTNVVLKKQLQENLEGIEDCKPGIRAKLGAGLKIENLIITYEPVWAIGTGNFCQPVEARKTSLVIKKTLVQIFNKSTAQKISILYGGSVNSKNARDYIKEAQMDGLLVGGASLQAKEFIRILKKVSTTGLSFRVVIRP